MSKSFGPPEYRNQSKPEMFHYTFHYRFLGYCYVNFFVIGLKDSQIQEIIIW